METFICFYDLSFEKQEEILSEVKKRIKEQLEEEAKIKKITLKKLLWEDYDLDYDLDDKEKEECFDLSLDEFLEEKALKKINQAFKYLSVYIDLF